MSLLMVGIADDFMNYFKDYNGIRRGSFIVACMDELPYGWIATEGSGSILLALTLFLYGAIIAVTVTNLLIIIIIIIRFC